MWSAPNPKVTPPRLSNPRTFLEIVSYLETMPEAICCCLHGGSIRHVDRSRSSSRRRSDNERATRRSRSPNLSPSAVQRWIRRFERFRIASGLAQKEGVNTLIYAMGDQAHDILRSFALSGEDRKNYNAVKAKFDSHFV